MKLIKPFLLATFAAAVLTSCGGGSAVLSTPVENIDNTPLKELELTESEKHNWGHLDLVKDTIPGMSVDRAYEEIIKDKKGKTVIVAVIDSGIDIEHEDLDDVVWTNEDEIPGNGIDDDKNGYVDDIHGWNFLGDAYDEQLPACRKPVLLLQKKITNCALICLKFPVQGPTTAWDLVVAMRFTADHPFWIGGLMALTLSETWRELRVSPTVKATSIDSKVKMELIGTGSGLVPSILI